MVTQYYCRTREKFAKKLAEKTAAPSGLICEVGISIDQFLNRFQIAADGGAHHRPDIHAAPARPRLELFTLERFGLDHARDFGVRVGHNGRPSFFGVFPLRAP